MESKNWSFFDLDFQVTIYPCAIPFSKQTLYFNSSLLQKGLLIAQALAMALTRSTVIVNDDVTASTIIGANTGTVIQDNKLNEDAQAQESKIDYELDISSEPMDCNHVVVNDLTPASETEMEAEIAAIETQCYRATIERWLAEAQLDRDCGFPSPTAVTGHHAKIGNC